MRYFKHGQNCKTKTYPMTCKYCGQKVFYFSCTCGSKVFFDDLGKPWPQHRCAEYRQAQLGYYTSKITQPRIQQIDIVQQTIAQLQEAEIDVQDLQPEKLALKIAEQSLEFSEDYQQRILQAAQAQRDLEAKKKHYKIEAQPPYKHGQTDFADGIVRELIENVNIAKKLKMQNSGHMGKALLGELSKGNFTQITIYSGALEEDTHDSFTFFIKQSLFNKFGVIRGDFIEVHLRSIQIPGRDPVWVCDEIHGVFE